MAAAAVLISLTKGMPSCSSLAVFLLLYNMTNSYFMYTSTEYIFSCHINPIPNTSAELRTKRQTELETWRMVPIAGHLWLPNQLNQS